MLQGTFLPSSSFHLNTFADRQLVHISLPSQAAMDNTSPARGDANLPRLNSSVSVHTPSLKPPSYKCMYTGMLILSQAITEGVGLATVTNTSQPLKSQRPRHLRCLLKNPVKKHNPETSHKLLIPKENSEGRTACDKRPGYAV